MDRTVNRSRGQAGPEPVLVAAAAATTTGPNLKHLEEVSKCRYRILSIAPLGPIHVHALVGGPSWVWVDHVVQGGLFADATGTDIPLFPTQAGKPAKICRAVGCGKQCTFGFPAEKARRCKIHLEDGMVDVKNKKCKHPGGCKTRPCFGYPDEPATRCEQHKEKDMVNVVSNKCKHPDGCGTIASFGYPDKPATRCAQHKEERMVDVVSRKCKHPGGCNTRPCFGYPDEPATRCEQHKEKDMVDVIHSKCSHPDGCGTRAHFGYPGEQATRCAQHKEEGMLCQAAKACDFAGCDSPPTCGFRGRPANRCDPHKLDGQVDLTHRTCASCGVLHILDTELKCSHCSGVFHHKEAVVVKALQEASIGPFIHDRQIPDTNIRYRPDILFSCKHHTVILEVDEHQHDSYDQDAEVQRMKEIQAALGQPVTFLRYNPDEYQPAPGARQVLDRIPTLIDRVRKAIDRPPNNACEAVYIFYDGYAKEEKVVVITPSPLPGEVN